jgi:protein-S-isoprenylcysteine O-methyltransferase Ste14
MELLARFRVALGWVVAPLVLIVALPTATSLVVGGLIAAAGEAIRVWAAGHLSKAREVTASGPYRWSAHPLYVGSSVMGAGLAVASASPIAAALIVLYLAVTLKAAVRSEEAFLRRRFGEQYDLYRQNRAAARTHALAHARRFSLAQAMRVNREYRAVVGLVAALLLLALKATYNGSFWREGG